MTKFRFSFQKILDLKENEKEFAQLQMANAIKKQEESQRRKDEIYQKIITTQNLMNEKQSCGVNVFELRMLENYVDQLKEQLMNSSRELENSQTLVSKSQNNLRMKMKEEKTWVNLKEKKLSEFIEQSKLIEQNLFDEMASIRYYRMTAERW